jgi:hypothetical protein
MVVIRKSNERLCPFAEVNDVSVDSEDISDESNDFIGVLEFLTNPILFDEVLGFDGDDSGPCSGGGGKQHHKASTGVQGLESVLIDSTQGTLAGQQFLAGRDGRGYEH